MEIIRTKIWNSECNVIFTGSHYYFMTGFNGVIAVAERKEDTSHFHIRVKYADVEVIAKRVINRNENRYVSTDVTYDVEVDDSVSYGCLKVEYINR